MLLLNCSAAVGFLCRLQRAGLDHLVIPPHSTLLRPCDKIWVRNPVDSVALRAGADRSII